MAVLAAGVVACGDDEDTSEPSTAAPVASDQSATSAPSGGATGGPSSSTAPSKGKPASGEPYEIQIVADLTGPAAASGLAGDAGARAAIKAINEAGGVNGHPIEAATSHDSASTPAGAQTAVRQAVDADPAAIFAFQLSTGLSASVPVLNNAKVPYFSAVFLRDLLVPKPAPWFFTSSLTDQQQATLAVAGLKSKLGGNLTGKRIGLEILNSPLSQQIAESISKAIVAAGGEVAITEQTASASVASFTSQAGNMVAAKIDGVVTLDSAANTIVVAKALAQAGFTGPILSNTANDEASMKNIGAPNFLAGRTVKAVTPGTELYALAERYGVADKTSNTYFTSGWILAYSLKAGLERCGFPCDAEQLTKSLESLDAIDAGAGDITYGPLSLSPTKHNALSSGQFYSWDAASSSAKPSGDVIDLSR